jgi:ribonuclease HI
VAEHNRLKALYVFWTTDLEAPVDRHRMEAICSMAQRYSLVYRQLGPLMGDLWSTLRHWPGQRRHHKIHLSDDTKATIRLWRSFLIASELRANRGYPRGRDIDSFRLRFPSFVLEFDGSLKGLGFRIFSLLNGVETLIYSGAVILSFCLFGQAKYQNAMELAAVVCGLASLAQRGVRRAAVRLRGDSMSVLQWTSNSQTTFKSTIARNAAMVFTAIAGRFDYIMSEDWQHISSEANWVCDNLSRNVPITNELTGPEGCQSPTSHPYIDEITSLCNPLTNPNTDIQYAERWALIDSTLSTY